MDADTADLLERFNRRDRLALARVLSRVESGTLAATPPAPRGPTYVVGITGSGGAGKSTLVGALVAHLRQSKLSVAVLACDPQSPLTGGALLGDRVRVKLSPDDDGVYFRSLSTRGAMGGVSAATAPAIEWLKAFGFDVVLVETVGVGQDQWAVRSCVDTLALLVTPHTGDEIQWEKAGLIEVADVLVVNKSDLPGADRVRQQLIAALSLAPGKEPATVLNCTAATGDGIARLWDELWARRPPNGDR